MTIDRLRELYNATPFQPFAIFLADGRKVPVYRRDWMMLAPSGRTVVVAQPDDSVSIINVDDSLRVSETDIAPAAEGSSVGRFSVGRPPSKAVLMAMLACFALASAAMLLLSIPT